MELLREIRTECSNVLRESMKSWLVRGSLALLFVLLLFYICALLVNLSLAQGFGAHGYCLLWLPGLITLFVGSDTIIGASYVAISVALGLLILQVYRTHRTIPFSWVFIAFGIFIIACGTTHFMDVWTLWVPAYWLAGADKFLTAVASVLTAAALPFQIPKVLALIDNASMSERRREELEEAHSILDQEATQQQKSLPLLAQQLIDTSRLQRDFVTNVSHEYRTALFAIYGFSEQLRDEDCTPEEVKKYAANINEQSQRLERLIGNLLDFEQMKSGAMSLSTDLMDLNVLIRKVYDHFSLAFKTYRFRLELGAEEAQCLGNLDRIEQVLFNLINNAMKYSEGEIAIGCEVHEGMVQAWVQDHGDGIPSDLLEKVFQPYFRLGVSRTAIKGGSGLGLSISRQIIQMHKGKIWAEATEGGSRFCFTIPRVLEHAH